MTPEMYRNAKSLVTNSPHFEKDCEYFFCQLSNTFDWFKELDIFRQLAVLAFALMIGWNNFLALPGFLALLANKDFEAAADEVSKKGYEYVADALKNGKIKFD